MPRQFINKIITAKKIESKFSKGIYNLEINTFQESKDIVITCQKDLTISLCTKE